MEIRNSLLPSLLLPAQTQPGQGVSAVQQPAAPVPNQSPSTGSTLAEYVSQGELLDGQRSGNYGDLIREARQQRVHAATQRDIQPGSQPAYATRALSAYQANIAAPTAATPSGRIDETA